VAGDERVRGERLAGLVGSDVLLGGEHDELEVDADGLRGADQARLAIHPAVHLPVVRHERAEELVETRVRALASGQLFGAGVVL
jgi:hypothetical protein